MFVLYEYDMFIVYNRSIAPYWCQSSIVIQRIYMVYQHGVIIHW